MIKLGICTSIDNAQLMKEIGYDYVELGLSSIALMEENEYQELLQKVKASPLPVESANSMLPGDFVLCSEEGTGERVRAYLEKAFTRAEELGIEMVVFGSGAARRLPDDMSESEGYKLLSQFLRMAASIAERHLITIAIEPLRAEECNIINFVSDAQRLAAMTMRVNVGALADLYHMMSGGDYYDELENGIGIIHAHIAEERYRSFPKKEDPCYPEYEEFFISLKRAGYEGRVSIEGHANDFVIDAKEAYEALDPLRR